MSSFNLLVIFIGVALAIAEVSSRHGGYDDHVDYNSRARCLHHERYSACDANPTCQKTCDNLGQHGTPCPRTKICIDGCVCVDGYVRRRVNGPCVREQLCPRVRH
ncbi:allergen Api m 6 [Cephus cinctus]|uniref:Allergen Api m 6 n=1 Tax=Cephus cinctus TaxID=211228 RepID=A0AAJ7CC24_CEPCN|nr:allergen Api m 6 [Cephus cinctus]